MTKTIAIPLRKITALLSLIIAIFAISISVSPVQSSVCTENFNNSIRRNLKALLTPLILLITMLLSVQEFAGDKKWEDKIRYGLKHFICFLFLMIGMQSAFAQSTTTLNPIKDTWLDAAKNNENYGTSAELNVDRESGKPERIILQFDLSGIPSGSTITSASLKLTKTAGNADINVAVRKVTSDWDEGIVDQESLTDGEASWDDRKPDTAWSTAGGDHGSAVSALNAIVSNGVLIFQNNLNI